MRSAMLFLCTHGPVEPERATLPFVAANVAAAAGQSAVVVCTIEAVWLGTRGGADPVAAAGLPALGPLLREFVANGGALWLCGASTRPRGITEDQLVPGAQILGTARIAEALAAARGSIALA